MPRLHRIPGLWLILGAIALGAVSAAFAAMEERAATPAELADAIRNAERIVIVFREGDRPKVHRDALVEDRDWFERLASVIEAGPIERKSYCFCVSTPVIEVYRSGEPMLRLTLHHESKLRLGGRFGGDYDIGVERRNAVLDLIVEHRANATDRLLPPAKAKPKSEFGAERR